MRWRLLVDGERSPIAFPRAIRNCIGPLVIVVSTGWGTVMEVLFLFVVICIVEVTLGLDEGGKVPRRSDEEGELRASMKTVALHRVRIPYQRLATNLIIA